MKKIIAWILAVIMLCTSLTACGEQQSSPSGTTDQTSSEEMREITHRYLVDLYGYIIRCEYLYGDMYWALNYLTPFFEDHSWDSLLIARAALSMAKHRANAIEPLEEQMTFDDYDKLIQSGADVNPTVSTQAIKDNVLLDYQVYGNYLNSPAETIFLNYDLAYFENWTSITQQIYEIHLQNCAVLTDYSLLNISNEEEKAQFIGAITEKCPQINALRKDNPQDQDALIEKSNSFLDELETLANDLSVMVGQAQAGLELFRDKTNEADSTDNLNDYVTALAADVVDLKDFPIALPYPDWWYQKANETFTYLWHDTEDEPIFFLPGDTIDTPPDEYIAEWADVSLEDYLSYVESIERRFNIPSQYTSEKEGKYTTYYGFQSASFALLWEENKVSLYTLNGSVCFAPPWYVINSRLVAS